MTVETSQNLSPMAAVMLDIINRRTGTSFVELVDGLDAAGRPTRGDYALEPTHNIVFWGGVSREFCDAVNELKSAHAAHPHLLGPLEAFLVYTADGAMVNLPYAVRPPKGGYRSPHWAPVVWYPGPGCAAKNCVGGPRR